MKRRAQAKRRRWPVIREGAEAQGYRVEGFAPTSRAAQKLAEAVLRLRRCKNIWHAARGRIPASGVFMGSMFSARASTKQIHEIGNRLHPNDRLLSVCHRRQHEAIEAAWLFAQLQDAGMKTVKLEQIVRQKDPELKQVVEQLALGEVRESRARLGAAGPRA